MCMAIFACPATAGASGGQSCIALPKHGPFPPFPFTGNQHLRNPTVELPISLEEILDVDAVIVTHTHEDHWDDVAKSSLPKNIPILVQNDADAAVIREAGFLDVMLLGEDQPFDSIEIIKTSGQHGSDAIMAQFGEPLGLVSGFVMKARGEKTLYLAGDTVWNDHVAGVLGQYRPDVVILNSGDAQIEGVGSIIMNKEDVREVFKAAPEATLICSHMQAVNHAMLTRTALNDFVAENHMGDRTLVPADGESYTF